MAKLTAAGVEFQSHDHAPAMTVEAQVGVPPPPSTTRFSSTPRCCAFLRAAGAAWRKAAINLLSPAGDCLRRSRPCLATPPLC